MEKIKVYLKRNTGPTKAGFTLIEVLVVITIIGLLASIILASVSTARNKANDAKIKAQLRNFKSVAELYYHNAGNYTYGSEVSGALVLPVDAVHIGSGCTSQMFNESSIQPFMLSANYPSYVAGSGKCTVSASSESYTVSAKLSDGNYWCVDSKGNAGIRLQSAGLPGDSAEDCFVPATGL